MINVDFNLNVNFQKIPNIDEISFSGSNQIQSIPSFSSMNFNLEEEVIMDSKENIISPQFKQIYIDNYKIKENNKEELDNICEIKKGDKNIIILEKEKEQEKQEEIKK